MTAADLTLAWTILPEALLKTLYMIFASALIGTIIGLPLGIILTITQKGHLKPRPTLNKSLGAIVNILRSFPFAILIIALIPFTHFLIGTSLGTNASIVPLTIAAAPFIARIIESALNEVDKQIIDAAIVMGSNTKQIVTKVLLREALPSMISGLTLTVVNLIGYSAMVGLVGGGGLGQVAIQYGYQRFNIFIMITTVILLILLVQLVQWIGNKLAYAINFKRGKAHRV